MILLNPIVQKRGSPDHKKGPRYASDASFSRGLTQTAGALSNKNMALFLSGTDDYSSFYSPFSINSMILGIYGFRLMFTSSYKAIVI